MEKNRSDRRSFALYTTLRSLIIVGIALGFYALMALLNISIDATSTRRYSLDFASKELLGNLTEPLSLYYLVPANRMSREGVLQIDQLLQEVARTNSLISYQAFAMDEKPLLLATLLQPEDHIEPDSLIIQQGTQYRILTPHQLLSYHITSRGERYLIGNNTEQLLVDTLLQFNHKERYRILLVDNHAEIAPKNLQSSKGVSLQQLIEDQGYDIVTGSLLVESLEPIDTILFLSPSLDLSPQEIERLEEWQASGKRIYLSLPFQAEVPYYWQEFLQSWQIALQPSAVVEENPNFLLASDPDKLAFLATLHLHPITQAMQQQNLRPIMRLPRHIEILTTQDNTVKHEVVLSTSPQNGLLIPENQQVQYQSNPLGQPRPLAIAIERENPNANPSQLYIISGDTTFLHYNYANEFLMLQAIDWLHQQVQSIQIPPKNLFNAPMHGITAKQAIPLAILIVIVIPLLLIFAGMTIYLHRKRR
ncbi:Gldg family protein [Entomospira culicis]|uniref:ABC-type uncharacterized transport system domain-containing protein n=1 Tax=Entomospira culicis TaxID=2719989 RepID=A0A968GIT3_9SPIO|nr:Gldg family protein [Entomospira culicis]NIZ19253.1 hypothetical protein [Entomospira culicis]NIZ69842.1 hypothetical protein [Entomospira culicis]WDI36948.1 Gldg family protein [Entomospira culicis]WDI38577.1 Gldg family protein [Entomospira culicis]